MKIQAKRRSTASFPPFLRRVKASDRFDEEECV